MRLNGPTSPGRWHGLQRDQTIGAISLVKVMRSFSCADARAAIIVHTTVRRPTTCGFAEVRLTASAKAPAVHRSVPRRWKADTTLGRRALVTPVVSGFSRTVGRARAWRARSAGRLDDRRMAALAYRHRCRSSPAV